MALRHGGGGDARSDPHGAERCWLLRAARSDGAHRDHIGNEPVFPDIAGLEAHLRHIHAPFGALTDAEWRHLAETSARPAAAGGVTLHYDPAIATPIRAQEAQALDMKALWGLVKQPVLLIRGAESDLLLEQTAQSMATGPMCACRDRRRGPAPALMNPAQIALVAAFLAQ